MRIHGVESSDDFTRIITSAATITFLCDGSWAASAGSGERALATGQLSPPTGPWRVTDHDDDSVVIIGGSWQLRINGDSLVELERLGEPGDVSSADEQV